MTRWIFSEQSVGRPHCHRAVLGAIACVSLALSIPAKAQFSAAVTPPRFEVSAQPGQVVRQVIEITHAATGTGQYRLYTTDWELDASGALTFLDPLQEGSCRPWVSLERREIKVSSGARLRFRFEVSVPGDVAPKECRFALMVEGNSQEVHTGENASIPTSGRIAVIVYVRVGDAKPVLELGASSVGRNEGRPTPVVTIHNSGNATGRLSGVLKGIDAGGENIEFTPEDAPVLPGQTRGIALVSRIPSAAARSSPPVQPLLRWPLAISGALEYGSSGTGRVELERTFLDRPPP
jgi:hypothetical protein